MLDNRIFLSFVGIVFVDFLYVGGFMPHMLTKNDHTPLIAFLTLPFFILVNDKVFSYIKRTYRENNKAKE